MGTTLYVILLYMLMGISFPYDNCSNYKGEKFEEMYQKVCLEKSYKFMIVRVIKIISTLIFVIYVVYMTLFLITNKEISSSEAEFIYYLLGFSCLVGIMSYINNVLSARLSRLMIITWHLANDD